MAILYDTYFVVALSFVLFMALLYRLKVHEMAVKALDDRAEGIRRELDEARRLREEAQAVLAEYQRKRKEAEAEAETILSTAEVEAERMTTDARAALDEMISRRTAAAETKIAQAENFIRSATAPEISAGVIAANMPRNATVASVIPPSSPVMVRSFRNAASKLPIHPLSNGTWASE